MENGTDRLYEERGDLFEFEAEALQCRPCGDDFELVLDRSAFFPGGGGQSPDTGTIEAEDGIIPVTGTRSENGIILHKLPRYVEPGRVFCRLDREKRFMRMQNHSGEHIISGIAHKRFDCNNVGFHMSEDKSGLLRFVTVDFDKELSSEQLSELELEANRAVFSDIPVSCFVPSREELSSIPYRSKKELFGDVRLVSISGIDLCACCAPHVGSTGKIGMIKITGAMRYKGGSRLEIRCGGAALEDYRARQAECDEITALLSLRGEGATGGVRKLLAENAACGERERALSEALCDLLAEKAVQGGARTVFSPVLDSASRRRLALRLAVESGGICAVLTGNDAAGYDYAAASCHGTDLRALAAEMKEKLGGSGGGRPELISGKVLSSEREIREFFKGIRSDN